MSQAFTGEIRLLPYTFAPLDWAWCNGQLLSVNQYAALYSILGKTFGGDGVINFGLPNLQARTPMGAGNGSGLTPRAWSATGGNGTASLSVNQLPAHTHILNGDNVPGTQGAPSAQAYQSQDAQNKRYEPNPVASNMVQMGVQSLASSGGGQPHENRQPWLAINHCICLNGQYPPHQ